MSFATLPLCTRVNAKFLLLSYRFRHWMFQWKQDDEGDIALVVFGFLAFVKYKEHTLIRTDGAKMKDAPKYVRADC